MKTCLSIAAATLLAGSAAESHMLAPVPPGVPANCPISVSFGSYASGIDQPTFARMELRLRADRRVRSFTRHPWGREGEVTLCVHPARPRDRAGLAQDLRAMIPPRPRGPIQVHVARRPRF